MFLPNEHERQSISIGRGDMGACARLQATLPFGDQNRTRTGLERPACGWRAGGPPALRARVASLRAPGRSVGHAPCLGPPDGISSLNLCCEDQSATLASPCRKWDAAHLDRVERIMNDALQCSTITETLEEPLLQWSLAIVGLRYDEDAPRDV